MNDRIEDLMAQAGFDPVAIRRMGVMPQAERFAELIVKKCANIVWDEAEKTGSVDVNDAGYKIISYFHGVGK